MISLKSSSKPKYQERGLIGYINQSMHGQLMLNFHWFENLTIHNRESGYASKLIFDGRRILIPAIEDSNVEHGKEVNLKVEQRLVDENRDKPQQTLSLKSIIYRLTEDKVIALPIKGEDKSHTEIILPEREILEIYPTRRIIEAYELIKKFFLAAGGRDNAYFWEARDGILRSLGVDKIGGLERELPVDLRLEEPQIEAEESYEIREIINEVPLNPLLKMNDLRKLRKFSQRL